MFHEALKTLSLEHPDLLVLAVIGGRQTGEGDILPDLALAEIVNGEDSPFPSDLPRPEYRLFNLQRTPWRGRLFRSIPAALSWAFVCGYDLGGCVNLTHLDIAISAQDACFL